MRKPKNHRVKRRIVVICIGILFLLFASVSFSFLSQEEKVAKSSGTLLGNETTVTEKNRIAFIIDDIGYDPAPVHKIVQLDIPITLSILPHCPYSRKAAAEAALNGLEVILHLPMEPYEYPEKNPGEGALFTHMTKGELIDLLEEDIEAVPAILGVNNHMGSLFMESEDKLTIVFSELKKRNLFFVDSYTTSNSMGRRVAKKTGIVYASRNIFIDNNGQYRDTFEILDNLIKTRDRWKTLILIGHPYGSTLEALKVITPLLMAKGIDIVPLSTLVKPIS